MMSNPCDYCGKNRDRCSICGVRNITSCVDCSTSELLRKYNNTVYCRRCYKRNKCVIEGCNKFIINCMNKPYCKKPNSITKFNTCLEHTHFTICSYCIESRKCDKCHKYKDSTWTHECGKFCTDCVYKLEIDISPATLIKLLPEGHRCKNSCVETTKRNIYVCIDCLEDRTLKDIQIKEMWKYYGALEDNKIITKIITDNIRQTFTSKTFTSILNFFTPKTTITEERELLLKKEQ